MKDITGGEDIIAPSLTSGICNVILSGLYVNCVNNGFLSKATNSGGICAVVNGTIYDESVEDFTGVKIVNCYYVADNGWIKTADGRTSFGDVVTDANALCDIMNKYIIENNKKDWKTWTPKDMNLCLHATFNNGVCADCGKECEHPEKDENYRCSICGEFDKVGAQKELAEVEKTIDELGQHAKKLETALGTERTGRNPKSSSTFSAGSIGIICGVAGLIVGGLVVFFIMRKKKTALAGAAEATVQTSDKTDEE